ncbi:rhodanese-like domain-containing protein [Chloroflexota bacterium]
MPSMLTEEEVVSVKGRENKCPPYKFWKNPSKLVSIVSLVVFGVIIFGISWFVSDRLNLLEPANSLPSPTSPTASTSPLPGTELPPDSSLTKIPRISVEEVKAKMDAGINLIILDSRPKKDYENDHIAGAISISAPTMADYFDDVKGYDWIITYCA